MNFSDFFSCRAGHSIVKNIMSLYNLSFFNLTVISFVIASVYTKGFFSSIYLRTYYTVGLILPVTPSVKVTRYRIVWLFLFFIFPLQFQRYSLTEKFCLFLSMNTRIKKYVSKVYRNIPIKKFYRCFHLYLLIFW